MNPILCIAGPTASGKSAWALSLAKIYDGEIVNADALQVYADLQIISARPKLSEMLNVPHHMFGHIDGAKKFSTGHWVREAQTTILEILARGKVPILVGGTGLYFKALTEGLANVPEPDPNAVTQAQSLLELHGIDSLRSRAMVVDPVATERVLGRDPQRLLRIVSVALGTARPLSEWQKNTKPILPKNYWLGAKLLPDRAALYAHINERFETMIERGGAREVQALKDRKLDPALPVMKAIGVPQILPFLDDIGSAQSALELAKRDTRRFAKRQFTWLRGNMQEWESVHNAVDKARFETLVQRKIEQFRTGNFP